MILNSMRRTFYALMLLIYFYFFEIANIWTSEFSFTLSIHFFSVYWKERLKQQTQYTIKKFHISDLVFFVYYIINRNTYYGQLNLFYKDLENILLCLLSSKQIYIQQIYTVGHYMSYGLSRLTLKVFDSDWKCFLSK